MKRQSRILIPALLLLSPCTYAGAVMDMVIQDASGRETGRSIIYAQSNMIRIDEVGAGQGDGSMIFLGDKLLYLDHREKSYFVMDEAMLDDVSAQMNEAMAEMERQLASMPPEQRAMVEQMMKGQMQGMMTKPDAPIPAPSVESLGSGKWQSHDCEKYAVFEGGEKTQEVCATDLAGIDGADEIMQAFRSMAAYITELAESMPMMADEGLNPGELMDKINGFPVHAIDFENGKVVGQSSLDSVTEKDLDPQLFAAPDGYLRQDPFD
ncbi:MAG: DUF4412 domain-containing protein [Gammaproteobacteria bacterium]|nr:DUF4412 domain-containing protein [Gammaproteobacteria bacterium]